MDVGDEVPRFIVDLSRPPGRRYDHIAPHFQERVHGCNLPAVFEDLLRELCGPVLAKWLGLVAQLVLRRLYRAEETTELRGISRSLGVPIHILVALNVLLDLLLGCTSGGVRAVGSRQPPSTRTSRMMHFRTLDWGMDPLRKIVLQLDFVRAPGGPVVATSVTYLGYVGVLTGVREGLSMSLNFRAHHSRDTWRQRLGFRWHQALVVLGFRQSISSVLRGFLLDGPIQTKDKATRGPDVHGILSTLSVSQSTAAYLIFCTPERVFVVEKDNGKALVRDSDTYLAAYNHDVADEDDPAKLERAAQELADAEDATGMEQLVRFSLDRKARLDKIWGRRVRSCRRYHGQPGTVVTQQDIFRFFKDPEIRNEETHYAVVMDPTLGCVTWARVYNTVECDGEPDAQEI